MAQLDCKMHVLIQIFLLVSCVLWTVEAQGCKIEDFKPKNMEGFTTHNLQKEYPVGAVVRVHCQTGYEGLYKMKCTQGGVWSSQFDECQRKKCGHPGESPNADFELAEGSSDFSFGSEVVYKCRPGYVMLSRSPTRMCMSQGWNNIIPICEALKCPPLEIYENMHAYGEYMDATAGTVVTLQCKSNDMIVDGPSTIECDNHGTWSANVPKCIIFKCHPPAIAHGRITNPKTEYSQNVYLQYECDDTYKKASSNELPQCIKLSRSAQWNPTPLCEQITCEAITSVKGTYTPPGQTIFTVGETLKVECSAGYWIQYSHKQQETATCLKSGHWNPGRISPICEEIRCENPDRHLRIWPRQPFYKFGDKVRFECERGYKLQSAAEGTCTAADWSPKPTCKGITCDPNDIKNARFPKPPKDSYKPGDTLKYNCLENLSAEHSARCTDDGWEVRLQCSGIEKCNSVKNGYVVMETSTIYYSCNGGYKLPRGAWWGEAQCKDGIWSNLQPCIQKSRCRTLPEIPHGDFSMPPPEDGFTGNVQVTCKKGYAAQDTYIKCTNGRWETPLPQCLPISTTCAPPPKVENAVVLTAYQKEYVDQTTVNYGCRKSYELSGHKTVTCSKGKWDDPPTCVKKSQTGAGTETAKVFSESASTTAPS